MTNEQRLEAAYNKINALERRNKRLEEELKAARKFGEKMADALAQSAA